MQGITVLAGMLAPAGVLVSTLYFARRKPGYSHLTHTISELAETGAPDARFVNWLAFFPIGILIWLFAAGLWQEFAGTTGGAKAALAFAGLGFGYAGAAVFPCDRGAPAWGTWRNQVHILCGALEYGGGGIGLLMFANVFAGLPGWAAFAQPTKYAGWAVLLIGMTLAQPSRFRGVQQRIVETILFAWMLAMATRLV